MSDPERDPPRFAVFVSPHGFGHAARSSAVMAEAHRRSGARFEVFTTTPRWFFEESIAGTFEYHALACDVGFRQRSALVADLEATVQALKAYVPFDAGLVSRLAGELRSSGCCAVLCDISALGIAVAEAAGLPSVLIENFSWPWLYEPFMDHVAGLAEISVEIARWDARATVHLQARPVCERRHGCELVDPISREATLDRAAARAALGLETDGPVVVITMGGYGEEYPFLDRLREIEDTTFVISGVPESGHGGNLRLFDNDTPLYMPDVLRAADAVVAKLGYGTVAEVWREGLPFAYVTRSNSREMPPLEDFAEIELSGFPIQADDFPAGAWIGRLPELLSTPRRARAGGGAARVSEVLLKLAKTA